MVTVINSPTAAAVTKYQQKAAQAKNNVSPRGGISGGSVQNNAAGTQPRSVLGSNAGNASKTAKATGKGKSNGKGRNN